jgi:hypothetical protein
MFQLITNVKRFLPSSIRIEQVHNRFSIQNPNEICCLIQSWFFQPSIQKDSCKEVASFLLPLYNMDANHAMLCLGTVRSTRKLI